MDGLIEGRIVHYVLRKQDADDINRRRQISVDSQPYGAQIHKGNVAREGDHVPMMVVKVWPNEFGEGVPGVNGQCFLDGTDQFWVTSARFGEGPGTCHWIEKA